MAEADEDRRGALLEVTSYDVALDLTGGAERFWSRARVRFRCREPGAGAWADLEAARLGEARLNGADVSGRYRDGRLGLPGLDRENTLVVAAELEYAAAADSGLHYTDGSPFVWSRAAGHGAPRIYCCFDRPELRAPFRISVTVPAGWSCLASAATAGQPVTGTWRFAPTPPLPPWLTSFCAGPLTGTGFSCERDERPPLPASARAVPAAAARLATAAVPGRPHRAGGGAGGPGGRCCGAAPTGTRAGMTWSAAGRRPGGGTCATGPPGTWSRGVHDHDPLTGPEPAARQFPAPGANWRSRGARRRASFGAGDGGSDDAADDSAL